MSKKEGCSNERMHMMMLGRDLMGLMFHRHFPPQEGSAIPQEPQERVLADNEKELYDGVVKFLTDEFAKGPRAPGPSDLTEKPGA